MHDGLFAIFKRFVNKREGEEIFPWNEKVLVAVNRAGLEPATSALSRQRSEPTELTIRGQM